MPSPCLWGPSVERTHPRPLRAVTGSPSRLSRGPPPGCHGAPLQAVTGSPSRALPTSAQRGVLPECPTPKEPTRFPQCWARPPWGCPGLPGGGRRGRSTALDVPRAPDAAGGQGRPPAQSPGRMRATRPGAVCAPRERIDVETRLTCCLRKPSHGLREAGERLPSPFVRTAVWPRTPGPVSPAGGGGGTESWSRSMQPSRPLAHLRAPARPARPGGQSWWAAVARAGQDSTQQDEAAPCHQGQGG